MSKDKLTKQLREIDAAIYKLTAKYLDGGMSTDDKIEFERWYDLKRIDNFNTDLGTKKKFYDETL